MQLPSTSASLASNIETTVSFSMIKRDSFSVISFVASVSNLKESSASKALTAFSNRFISKLIVMVYTCK